MAKNDNKNRQNNADNRTLLQRYLFPVSVFLIFMLLIAYIISTYADDMPVVKPPTTATDPTPAPTEPPIELPTQPQTEPPTEDATLPSEVLNEVAALIKQADQLAAGYDYDKAISMLQNLEYAAEIPEVYESIARYQSAKAACSRYEEMNTITHIFFHSLIVDTERAFGKLADKSGSDPAGYNQWMTTVYEFKLILESMYERGYVLVTPYQVAYEVIDKNGNAKFVEGDIFLPKGKKPFIMSQDDLNYYGYMIADSSAGVNTTPVYASAQGDGFAHKIIIGEDGKPTCEYMDANGVIHVGDYDLVPILEAFIQEHPDFAYQGARAVLGVTGYEGVFGYRTKPSYEASMGSQKYAQEVADAKAVAQCLKDNGWIIASHSYGHPHYGQIGAERVEADSNNWENTVQPIVGNCDIILYPHGDDIEKRARAYTFSNASFKALYEDGYRYFFNVDSSKYWVQMGKNYYRGGRRNVDGYRMWYHPQKLDDLFVAQEVFDPTRPTPVPQV